MKYVALLRGVNVGAHNRMKMADLKAALEGIGLARVETFIQSGNVLFESDLGESELVPVLRGAIEGRFGFSVELAVRSKGEMRALVDQLPFSPEEVARAEAENSEGERLYVYLLSAPPEEKKLARALALSAEGEQLRVVGRDVYLLLNHSVRSSKLAAHAQKLDAAATARNWNTITKLAELLEGMG